MGLRFERTDGKPDTGIQFGILRFRIDPVTLTEGQARAGRWLLGGFVGVGLLVLVLAVLIVVMVIR